MKKVIMWFVNSSVDPNKVSMTIRGLVPFLALLGVSHIDAVEFSDSAVDIIVAIGMGISATYSAVGFIRKVALSFGVKLKK